MSEKKNYLEELEKEASSKKIESFREEKIERIDKAPVSINPKLLIGSLVAIVVIIAAVYFLFLSPKIVMPNFIDKTDADIAAWAKQYNIENSGIVFQEEYNFDIEEGNIISQSVPADTMVSETVKITFVKSLGANPDEAVTFLNNLELASEDEIRDWIDENKLLRTKINLQFSDTISEGNVIDYELTGSEDSFVRDSSLTINISKGPEPASTITMPDFVEKNVAEVETWATSNKIDLTIVEIYTEDEAVGTVISQSVSKDTRIQQGSAVTMTVSKGKSITVGNFVDMTSDEFAIWKQDPANTGLTFIENKVYSADWTKDILSQSVAPNTQVESGTVVEIDVNIGLPRLDKSYIGSSLQTLIDWTNAERSKGADMYAGEWGSEAVYSKTYREGQIVSITCADANGKSYDCNGDLPLDARFSVVLSKGIEVVIGSTDLQDSASMVNFLASNQFTFSTQTIPGNISKLIVNGVEVSANDYIREGSTIVVQVAENQPTATTPAVVTPAP